MAARVTADEVKEIIEVDVSITNLNPFIDAASNLVTDLCSSSSYVAAKLKRIELWLAAHFVAIRDTRPASEGISGGPSVKYQSKVDLGLNVTHYGQMAMRIDTAGNLRKADKGIRIVEGSMTWLGSDLS